MNFLGLDIFWWSQIFAGFTIIFDLISFQFKQREHILLTLIIGGVCLGIHFLLLGQLVAGGLVLIASVRKGVAYFYPGPKWMLFFVVLGGLTTFYFYEHWHNLLAYGAMIVITIGNFQSHDLPMRRFQLVGTTTWLIHNALIRSPMAVIVEVIFLIGQLIGYYRHYGRKKSA